MFDFAHIYYLLFLAAIPLVWLLYYLSRRSSRNKIKKFGRPAVVARLMPGVSRYKHGLKLILCLIALAAIVIALARPRYGEKEDIVASDGAEIVIAFDVSRSMLAPSTDDPESNSRIERARMLLEKLIGSLKQDKVGLVVFAANARMQMPLTSDRRIVQTTLRNNLTPGMMSNQGTSLSQAIDMSVLTFPELRKQFENPGSKQADSNVGVHRAIILITDAEDHEGEAIESARYAASLGIQLDVIGVGTELGGRIPLGNGQYLRDNETNEEVVTRLNTDAAMQIAEAGDGIYVNASDLNALDKLQGSLDKLKKTEFTQVKYKMSAEQFPLFAWIALIFLILEIFVLESKTKWLKSESIFTHRIKGSHKKAKDSKKDNN